MMPSLPNGSYTTLPRVEKYHNCLIHARRVATGPCGLTDPDGNPIQHFVFLHGPFANQDGNKESVIADPYGRCLDISGDAMGTHAGMKLCTAEASQMFSARLAPNGNATVIYRQLQAGPMGCVEVQGASSDAKAYLVLGSCVDTPTDSQTFEARPVT